MIRYIGKKKRNALILIAGEDIHSEELHWILFSPIGDVMTTRTEDSGMFSYFIYVTDARTSFPNGDCPIKNMMRYNTQGSILRL